MLPEVVWAMPRLGTFNLHASLLPQYRGAAPINWAVMNGDKETGATTCLLKHEIDTGNMILQERIPIGEDENVGSVHDRLMALGASMVTRTVDLIIDCENKGIALPTTPQPELAEMRPAPKIFKEDCEIRFADKTAEEVHNFVRGLSPYPAAWANLTIHGQRFENVKVYKVEAYPHSLREGKGEVVIPCKEGAVSILELQVPGKKRMDIKSFLNGLHG
jgi:methionyl-tRNA formyltransferase